MKVKPEYYDSESEYSEHDESEPHGDAHCEPTTETCNRCLKPKPKKKGTAKAEFSKKDCKKAKKALKADKSKAKKSARKGSVKKEGDSKTECPKGGDSDQNKCGDSDQKKGGDSDQKKGGNTNLKKGGQKKGEDSYQKKNRDSDQKKGEDSDQKKTRDSDQKKGQESDQKKGETSNQESVDGKSDWTSETNKIDKEIEEKYAKRVMYAYLLKRKVKLLKSRTKSGKAKVENGALSNK